MTRNVLDREHRAHAASCCTCRTRADRAFFFRRFALKPPLACERACALCIAVYGARRTMPGCGNQCCSMAALTQPTSFTMTSSDYSLYCACLSPLYQRLRWRASTATTYVLFHVHYANNNRAPSPRLHHLRAWRMDNAAIAYFVVEKYARQWMGFARKPVNYLTMTWRTTTTRGGGGNAYSSRDIFSQQATRHACLTITTVLHSSPPARCLTATALLRLLPRQTFIRLHMLSGVNQR